MKVRVARRALSYTWVAGSLPPLLLVALLTFNEVYQEPDQGLLWLSPLLFPILGTIIGSSSWSIGYNETDDFDIESTSVFWLTLLLSIVYLVILYVGMALGVFAFRNSNWNYIMRATGWLLGSFQWLISSALTNFFIENIRPRPNSD